MDFKPMYFVNGHFWRGTAVNKNDLDPDMQRLVANNAERFNCTENDFLVLKDAEVIIHGGMVQRVAFIVIPLAHLSGVCVPPYEAIPIAEAVRLDQEEMLRQARSQR